MKNIVLGMMLLIFVGFTNSSSGEKRIKMPNTN